MSGWMTGGWRAIELQAGSPGRSPQCHPRRSRAVASRDVTRRCSDATSHQGQPTVMVAWQPLFALLLPLESRLPYSLPPSYPTSYRSRTLYLAYTCRCSMNSPRRLSLSHSLSLSRSLSLFFSWFPHHGRSVRHDVTLTPSGAFRGCCELRRNGVTTPRPVLPFSLPSPPTIGIFHFNINTR